MKTTDDDVTPNITITPTTATNKGWYLTSADPSIASIVNGTTIHAVKRGDVQITVISADNDKITDTFTAQIKNSFGF